ncbi:MAG: hypothetical protein HUJ29_12650 [Gammaproteobacteria bacterium]|nr:hypothetical protein [Gammaproteobacteria bacterium]
MPSSSKSRRVILELLQDCSGSSCFAELGSGWGSLVIPMARRNPGKTIIGYELSPVPYLVSRLLKRLYRLDNLVLYRKDFLYADLTAVDCLVCYLYPGGMEQLWHKLKQEKLCATVISNTFAFVGIEPERLVRAADLYNSPIYVYNVTR